MALAELARVAKKMEAKKAAAKNSKATSKAKTKTKSSGNSALLPAKVKGGVTIAEAFHRIKLPLSLAEVMMCKPEIHEAMELLVTDIAIRTGRPLLTIEGVATQQITKDMLKNRCATATYSRLNAFETSMMNLPASTITNSETTNNHAGPSSSSAARRKGKGIAGRERMLMFK